MACAALVSQLALMLARTMAASPSAPSGRQPEAADSSGPLPPPPPPPPVVCTRPTGRAGYDWDHGPAQETLLWSAFAVSGVVCAQGYAPVFGKRTWNGRQQPTTRMLPLLHVEG
jgi:hypothetical protein